MKTIFCTLLIVIFYLNIAKTQTWINYNTSQGLVDNFVNTVAIDTLNNIWFGTDNGVSMFDGTNWTTYTTADGLLDNYVSVIYIDSHNNKWFSTLAGVSFFNDSTWLSYTGNNAFEMDSLWNGNVYDIKEDLNGNFWFATDWDIWKFDGVYWTKAPGNVNSAINIDLDIYGNLWFSGNSQVFKFDGSQWIDLTPNSGQVYCNFQTMAIDAQNIKWFGAFNYGGYWYDDITWNHYYTTLFPFSNDVKEIVVDAQNKKYFGANSDGLSVFDGTVWTYYYDELNYYSPNSISIDQQGNKWIGTGGGGVFELIDGGAGPLNQASIIKGNVFNDLNVNGVQDPGEPSLSGKTVKILNDNTYLSTQTDGSFYFTKPQGTYQIKYMHNNYFELTSDSVQTVVINGNTHLVDSVNFGIKMLNNVNDVSVDITGNASRAGFNVNYWLAYKNEGSVLQSGNISLQIDSLTTIVSSNPVPNLQVGNTLTWNYSNLNSLEQRQILITLQMPDVSHLGDTIYTAANITPLAGDSAVSNNTSLLSQIITGSFDPNDKLVDKGVSAEGFTLFGEELTYTIRFQNTGTDTAFTIHVRDTVNTNMDMETLRIMSSSHNVRVDLTNQNVVTFIFDDILLPNSSINEPASHGFVKYTIMPKPGLAENTQITNTAYIYFDFNPAIITNEVLNTYVSTITTLSDNTYGFNSNMSIYPNPSNTLITFNINIKRKDIISLDIYNNLGIKIKEIFSNKILPDNYQYKWNVSNIESGVYFAKLTVNGKTQTHKLIILK